MKGRFGLVEVKGFPQPEYKLQERCWHWCQSLILVSLLVTGFCQHYPDALGFLLPLAVAVRWHSYFAWAAMVSIALGLLYHLAAGRFHHLIPAGEDFTWGVPKRLRYYFYGVFKGESHPFEKGFKGRMHPFTKLLYLVLLDLLIPWQVATGVALWVLLNNPGRLRRFDIGIMGKMHAMGAFLFMAILLLHIYFTTLGAGSAGRLAAMVTGKEGRREPPGTDPQN